MLLFFTTAAPQFLQTFSRSYNELLGSSAIFPSHDNDHVIYIFIWDLKKGTRPDPWNIKLIWYGLSKVWRQVTYVFHSQCECNYVLNLTKSTLDEQNIPKIFTQLALFLYSTWIHWQLPTYIWTVPHTCMHTYLLYM